MGGRPHNMDDCFDFMQREAPIQVTVSPYTENPFLITEFPFRELLAVYEWKFPSKQVRYSEECGRCYYDYPEKWQAAIDKANRRLWESANQIRSRGIPVIVDGDFRLDYA